MNDEVYTNVVCIFISHQYLISFMRTIKQNLPCFQSLWFSPNQLPPPKKIVCEYCFISISKTKQERNISLVLLGKAFERRTEPHLLSKNFERCTDGQQRFSFKFFSRYAELSKG